MSKNTFFIKAYPKINFILKVFPKTKEEIKHKIKSFFVLHKEYFDEIEVRVSDKLDISYIENGLLKKIENCVLSKSIQWFDKKFKVKTDFNFIITKRIPIGSGLGGMSSIVGNVLAFLSKNHKVTFNEKDLQEIAIILGSDIPFFYYNYDQAIVSNYGDIVEKTSYEIPEYTLDYFDRPIWTKLIFNYLDEEQNYTSKVDFDLALKNILNINKDQNIIYNDLEIYLNKVVDYSQWLKTKNDYIITGAGGTIIKIKK